MEIPKPRHEAMGKADALVLVFVGLKLAGQLDWNWWWVLSPHLVVIAASMAVTWWRLSATPSQTLMKKESAGWVRWSGRCRGSDALLLLLFVLKWTGHLSWSWFWVLSPLWLFKPLGILLAQPSRERRRFENIGIKLSADAVALILVVLIGSRLESYISSWWWVAPALPLSLILGVFLAMRMNAVFFRRLLRERAERQERHRRKGAPAMPPTVLELWKERQQEAP